tara:strand:- start:20315 stop:23764 length:3450 start_codon:yes stop_codon:yes gene_type:complete
MEFKSPLWKNIDIKQNHIFHGNINSSFFAFHINSFLQEHPHYNPYVLCSSQEIHAICSDISRLNPNKQVLTFEGHDVSPYSNLLPNRTHAKKRLRFLARSLRPLGNEIFVIPAKHCIQLCLSKKLLEENLKIYKSGSELDASFFEVLSDWNYQNVDTCEEMGQFANKGGILDIFTPYHDHPIRIELFGDQIESMRFYDPLTQLSLHTASELVICPVGDFSYRFTSAQNLSLNWIEDCQKRGLTKSDLDSFLVQIGRKSFFPELDHLFHYSTTPTSTVFDYIPNNSNLIVYDKIACTQDLDHFIEEEKREMDLSAKNLIHPPLEAVYDLSLNIENTWSQANLVYNRLALHEDRADYKILPCRIHNLSKFKSLFDKYQHSFDKEFFFHIQELLSKGSRVFVCTSGETRKKRLTNAFRENGISIHDSEDWVDLSEKPVQECVFFVDFSLNHSFHYENDDIYFLSEDLFFNKVAKSTYHDKAVAADKQQLRFSELSPGDKIIHIGNGVGVFEGMKELNIDGIKTELLSLRYKDGDTLYLPIYRIHQIQKYQGSASLDKLGSSNWEKAKVKVKNSLRDIAADLLKIYAARSKFHKTPYTAPDQRYYDFEDRFPYSETPDQSRSIEEILSDMQSEKPMDRLICGDVGFGKTEVAMRAAFKAAKDHRQVAVLVPTTILALQHFESFQQRFQGFDINIKMLSRFTPRKEIKEIIQGLKNGQVHVVIGTHRLLSSDIDFFHLGLLIIDEEHRFGVKHKEKIRQIKAGVDTLAMSATPIPRSLNMSIMGIRDLSLITTPPQDRLPIRTYLCKQNWETIKQAILNEIHRGGQVYFLHNRVQTIYQREQELRELLPNLRICVGHGQLPEDELEKIVVDFFHGKYDLFLCTTIIESGIDNPKANTIIIDNAQRFGLSQLYQIRGRVGRSKERAYCYLVVPPNTKLDKTAQERLRIIQENTDLGSGFKVASHDLDLRGAGNLLGEDQSGNINAVGYDLYLDLLEDAIKEAKGEEPKEPEVEPDINIPITALIPDKYIHDIRQRLSIYKQMSEASSHEAMAEIEEKIKDQYGKLPEEVINLMGIMMIRSTCKRLGIKDIKATTKALSLRFTENSKIKIDNLVEIAMQNSKKYKITPDYRLLIFMPSSKWEEILGEIENLERQLI